MSSRLLLPGFHEVVELAAAWLLLGELAG